MYQCTCGFCRCLWSFGVSEVVVVVIVMATVAAPGDMKRNLRDKNGVQLTTIDHLIGIVVWIHTKFHQLIAHQRNHLPTAGELLVSFLNIGT